MLYSGLLEYQTHTLCTDTYKQNTIKMYTYTDTQTRAHTHTLQNIVLTRQRYATFVCFRILL